LSPEEIWRFIGKAACIRNERPLRRPKDLAGIEGLEEQIDIDVLPGADVGFEVGR
jgi:hypothetical protein